MINFDSTKPCSEDIYKKFQSSKWPEMPPKTVFEILDDTHERYKIVKIGSRLCIILVRKDGCYFVFDGSAVPLVTNENSGYVIEQYSILKASSNAHYPHPFTRECPQCHREMTYACLARFEYGKTNSTICAECKTEKRRVAKELKRKARKVYSRECPQCRRLMTYKCLARFRCGETNSTICGECRAENRRVAKELKRKANEPKDKAKKVYQRKTENPNYINPKRYLGVPDDLSRKCPSCSALLQCTQRSEWLRAERLQSRCKSCAVKLWRQKKRNAAQAISDQGEITRLSSQASESTCTEL